MNSKVLADTDVWIAVFRKTRGGSAQRELADALEHLILEDRVVLCGVVELELLQGLRTGEREGLETALSALEFLPTVREDFQKAGELLGGLRRRGVTILATDGLIAAQCLRCGLLLLENDKHFAEVEGLRRYAWREKGFRLVETASPPPLIASLCVCLKEKLSKLPPSKCGKAKGLSAGSRRQSAQPPPHSPAPTPR